MELFSCLDRRSDSLQLGILHQLVQSRCCRTLSCVTVPFLFAVAVGSFTLNVPRVVAVSLFVPTRPLSIRPKTIFRFAVPRFSTGAFLGMNTSIPLTSSKKTRFYRLANLGGSILSPLGEFLDCCFLSRLLTFLESWMCLQSS